MKMNTNQKKAGDNFKTTVIAKSQSPDSHIKNASQDAIKTLILSKLVAHRKHALQRLPTNLRGTICLAMAAASTNQIQTNA